MQQININGHEDVPANSDEALLKVVTDQLVSVAIDASGSSSVFIGNCGTELDHGVTAICYGETSDGTKYWLVKNSWGTDGVKSDTSGCKAMLVLQKVFVVLP
ncbi:hypothetical protein MRB53_016958 [Persea americana]|uniref:Uncharacterized protein n=1 Tax=Persea americana TaxID=3435 RepID=A0ACC2M3U0_PERAE|nr:hypothetical protein MRB53_016958 [Persea americana]